MDSKNTFEIDFLDHVAIRVKKSENIRKPGIRKS